MANSSSLNKPTAHTSDAPGCQESIVHLDNVWQVQRKVLATEKAQQMAEFFGVLCDPHRLKLLSALAQQELCVCDLAAIVKMGESAVSHQLRVLRSRSSGQISPSRSQRLLQPCRRAYCDFLSRGSQTPR